jgi:hypothetical protein
MQKRAFMKVLGLSLGRLVLLMTKFNFSIEIEKIETNIRRLTNQLWKLIPMRENGENWER